MPYRLVACVSNEVTKYTHCRQGLVSATNFLHQLRHIVQCQISGVLALASQGIITQYVCEADCHVEGHWDLRRQRDTPQQAKDTLGHDALLHTGVQCGCFVLPL